jgi:hypothetical protein
MREARLLARWEQLADLKRHLRCTSLKQTHTAARYNSLFHMTCTFSAESDSATPCASPRGRGPGLPHCTCLGTDFANSKDLYLAQSASCSIRPMHLLSHQNVRPMPHRPRTLHRSFLIYYPSSISLSNNKLRNVQNNFVNKTPLSASGAPCAHIFASL